jgi:hypothetical protein
MSVLPLASPPVLALETAFISWLLSHGGSLHPSVALRSFEGMGRGLIALEDIPVRLSPSPQRSTNSI